MIKVAVGDAKELEKLLSAEQYLEHVNSLK
jgi:hypothetical protein